MSSSSNPKLNLEALNQLANKSTPDIDTLLANALKAIEGVVNQCLINTLPGHIPSRDTVQNLKDCVSMLTDLKKQEQALLDNATDEELEKLST